MRPIVALTLLCGALTACEGRPRGPGHGGPENAKPTHGPEVAVLDLSDGVPEKAPAGILGLSAHEPSFDDLVREIKRISTDGQVRAVLVRLGDSRIPLARAGEIGSMLQGLAAKLPVWCHADDLGNETEYLAARGCKRVWLSPSGMVETIGLAAQTIYFHELLANELGLDVDFLQVGKYKGAEEPFTRDGPSPEARASLESALADMRSVWLAGIHAGRPGVDASTPEDGPYAATPATSRGLVDHVGYFEDARDSLEKQTGAVRAEVTFGPGQVPGHGSDFGDLLRDVTGGSLGSAPVALVRAIGAISMESGSGVLSGHDGIVAARLSKTLRQLENDDDVRAVVLRIDSPGGSALASDLLWRQLMRVRSKKPLVVSIGGMAASGGYYLASAGKVVFADPTSIVGSIGVVGGKVAANRALARIGVHAETIPAKVGDAHAAARAALDSLLEPWDDATRGRLLETMTDVYQLFLSRISEGRGIPIDRVAASAEGRIFSGRIGKARGLVDELGGLREAVARARSLAGLPPDAPVAVAGEASGWLKALGVGNLSGKTQGLGVAPLGAALRAMPGVEAFVGSVAPVAGRERAVCALPFALTVR